MPLYDLWAIDIDGTLLNSRHELTPAVRAAIQRVRTAGVEVVLVTGRRYVRTLPFVEALGLNVPVVSASGALIKCPAEGHRTLFAATFSPALLAETLREIEASGFDPVLYADTFADGFDFYCPKLDVAEPFFAEYLEKNRGVGRAKSDLFAAPPPGVVAGFIMGPEQPMRALHDHLHIALRGELYLHVLRSPLYSGYMCEFAPAGVTKWSGLRKLADDWNIATERICAVGDDVNDLPMVTHAGLGVAMGNAVPELKAVAKRIAPLNDEDGLVQVASWIMGDD